MTNELFLSTRKFLDLVSNLLEEQSNLCYLNNSVLLFNERMKESAMDDTEVSCFFYSISL